MKVTRPAVPTNHSHSFGAPRAGHSRISRNTPAFTIVAECR